LVHLVEVENQIELAHAPKVLVKHLHEKVDEFEHAEFVVFGVDAKGEKEACVPPVYNLVVPVLHANRRFSKGERTYLKETSHFVIPSNDCAVGFCLDFLALVVVVADVPATQSCFALPVLQKDEPYLDRGGGVRYGLGLTIIVLSE
jgi:hypothetical protein